MTQNISNPFKVGDKVQNSDFWTISSSRFGIVEGIDGEFLEVRSNEGHLFLAHYTYWELIP